MFSTSITGIKNSLLLLTVFLLPLIGATNGFGFELSKVIFFIFSISLCTLMWILDYKSFPIIWDKITKIASLFILTLLISSFFGIDSSSSFLGNEPYYQGWVLYLYLYLFYLLIRSSKITLSKFAFVIFLSSLLVSAIAIEDWVLISFLHLDIVNYSGRVISTFGQPNFYSGFVLMGIPFSIYLLEKSKLKFRIFLWISLGLEFAAIMISASRASIFLSIFLIFLWIILKFKINLKHKYAKLLGVLIVLITIYSVSVLAKSEYTKISDPQWLIYNSPEKRILIWPVVTHLIIDKPIFGYGLENLYTAFSKYPGFYTIEAKPPEYYKLRQMNIDRSHSYLLDIGVFSGLTGLLVYLLFLFKLFRNSKGGMQLVGGKVLMVWLVIYVIWSQFQNQSVAHLVYFWLVAGIISQTSILTSKEI